MAKPEVDICVLGHNRSDCTVAFLPNFVRNTANVRYKIWFLNNASTDGGQTITALRWFGANCRWYWPWARWKGTAFHWFDSLMNLGFSGGNNVLARHGKAPWVLFINNDAFPDDPTWLRRMLDTATEQDWDGIGPTSNYVIGLQGEKWNGRGWPAVHPAKMLSGFCMLVRRKAFEAIGGFDEQFFMGDEDLDLSIRLRGYGYERGKTLNLGIDRRVYVQHACSSSMGPWCEARGKSVMEHFRGTREQLVVKHGIYWERDLFMWEDLLLPESEWHKLGVLKNGQLFTMPGTEKLANERIERARANSNRARDTEVTDHRSRAEGSNRPGARELRSGGLSAAAAEESVQPRQLHPRPRTGEGWTYHRGNYPDGTYVSAGTGDTGGCPFEGDSTIVCATCGAGVYKAATA